MKSRIAQRGIALALLPVAAFSLAAKENGCTSREDPVLPPASDAETADAAEDAATPDAKRTCAQRTSDARNEVIGASSRADTSCRMDSDCAVVWTSTVCWNTCATVVSKTGAATLNAAIAQINAATCATFGVDQCDPGPVLPCAPYLAFCVNGACTDRGP